MNEVSCHEHSRLPGKPSNQQRHQTTTMSVNAAVARPELFRGEHVDRHIML